MIFQEISIWNAYQMYKKWIEIPYGTNVIFDFQRSFAETADK